MRRSKRKVNEEWGVKVVTYTSAPDTGTAWEGPGLDGYQLWEDTVFPEVLAPDSNDAVADGEVGELVATDIDNRATPTSGFRSAISCVSREPSSIGRTHARMWVSGRAGDETIVAGKAIAVADVWAIVEAEPELSDGMFQIIRAAEGVDATPAAAHRVRTRAHVRRG